MRDVNDFSYGPSTLLIRLKTQQENSISPRMLNLEGKHKKGIGKGDHNNAKKKSTDT